MPETLTQLPTPNREAVAIWLRSLTRVYVHRQGWRDVNRRFNPITMAVRGFLQVEYPDATQREAAFDGLTLGLMAMGHFDDVRQLAEMFGGDALESGVDGQLSLLEPMDCLGLGSPPPDNL